MTSALLVSFLSLNSCDKPSSPEEKAEEDHFFEEVPQVVDHLHQNQMSREPSDFLRSRSEDPINWQGWSPTLLQEAKQEQRLVFAVLASPRFQETAAFFDSLLKRPRLINRLNNEYVCTLIDIDVHPEEAIKMATLCNEIRRPVNFPSIAWLSHEGSPVAWLPLTGEEIDSFDEVFDTSDVMVSRIWKDSPRYVVVNSAHDDKSRADRIKTIPAEDTSLEALRQTTLDAVRQLASLYDPTSGLMDGTGGLLPSNVLILIGSIGQSNLVDAGMKESLRSVALGLSNTLESSAIRDPLDHGFFSARRARDWGVPLPLKSADTQSAIARAYALNAGWTDAPRNEQVAREVMAYAEREFAAGSKSIGNYVVVTDEDASDRSFYWSREEIQDLLPANVFSLIEQAYGISGLGNIPLEADPRRNYFRKNTLAQKKKPGELAETLGISIEEAAQSMESGRKILLAHRQDLLERSAQIFKDETRITSVNANYIAALARLARTTGDQTYLSKAQAGLAYLRSQHYSESDGLMRIRPVEGRRLVRARGIDYSSLLNALFAVYRADLDPAHLAWAISLAEEAIDVLSDEDGTLLECPTAEATGATASSSNRMIFGESTWGTIYGSLERLKQLTDLEPIAEAAEAIRARLLSSVARNPVIHTDFLHSALVPLTDTVVCLEGSPGDAEFDALHSVLLQAEHDAVTLLHVGSGLPAQVTAKPSGAPGATVFVGGQEAGKAVTAEELRDLLAPEGS